MYAGSERAFTVGEEHVDALLDQALHRLGHAAEADGGARAVQHVEGPHVGACRLERGNQAGLGRLRLPRRVGGHDGDAAALEGARRDEVFGQRPQIALQGGRGGEQAPATPLHVLLRQGLVGDQGGIVLLGDAELGGPLEARRVQQHDGLVVLGGLDAGGIAQRVDVGAADTQRGDLYQP